MTGQRMTPEREAEPLTAEEEVAIRRFHIADDLWVCRVCRSGGPCWTMRMLATIDTERAHAQQVEVPHSSAAVLGYSVARQDYGIRDGAWVITDKFCTDAVLDPALVRDDILEDGEIHVAVVRVGADGRIGS